METLSEVTKVTPTDKVIPRFQLPFFSLCDVVLVLVFVGLRELVFFFFIKISCLHKYKVGF